jgi:pimeloyl-ACP methyl ester carboxylesterase
MPHLLTVNWDKVDQPVSGLVTDDDHFVFVRRESIPLVFVPGIMGSRLRLKGTNGKGKTGNLPNLRWDPGAGGFMWWYYSGKDGAYRKSMLVGPTFSSTFLEVDNANPVGDGFSGIMEDYCDKFLNDLKKRDWGPLGKIFEFPVYAFGYNWTDSNENSGRKLAARIKEIISEAKQVTGLCEKVILITHSMGGLVARWASEWAGAQGNILGVIHGVQPATGAPAAYWRIKAGFEGNPIMSRVLGKNAYEVTPVLGNLPGGLQLLPSQHHVTNAGSPSWLTITQSGQTIRALPGSNPYNDIYRVKAVVKPAAGVKPSNNAYWGLVDPALLDPDNGNVGKSSAKAATGNNGLDADADFVLRDPWGQYLRMLAIAEAFHRKLGKKKHPQTYNFWGVGHKTADVIELRAEKTGWLTNNPYPDRGFRGFFTDGNGKSMMAVLQEPAGAGDGTVPVSSASALKGSGKSVPEEAGLKVEHQPAYENKAAQDFTVKAIIALCKKRYESLRK